MASLGRGVLICQEEGCNGLIDKEKSIWLKSSSMTQLASYACAACGRLHHPTGVALNTSGGGKLFIENNKIVTK